MSLSLRPSLGLLLLCLFLGCTSEPQQPRQYLFLSHIYQWGVQENNRIDYRLQDFNFRTYDQVWLGGDLCARTAEREATLDYLDSIFDLSAPSTHWTLGNHDVMYGQLDWITTRTQRLTYYTRAYPNLQLAVLNTNEFYDPAYQPKPHECALLEGQLEMLQSLADTLSHARQFVLLHHYGVLSKEMTKQQLATDQLFNFYRPDLLVSCSSPGIFAERLYPILQAIQKKGIQVILVCGDFGQRAKQMEYRDASGIIFLASGINNSALDGPLPAYVTSTEPDRLLLFEHWPREGRLEWSFPRLDSLVLNSEK